MKNLTPILFIGMLFVSACNGDSKVQGINDRASLPSSFKFDSMHLKVMSSFINKRLGTMSILYASTVALNNAMSGRKEHAAGETMTLITWKQQADDHWFGANIPDSLELVEVVSTTNKATGLLIDYKKYNGKNLLADPDTTGQHVRIKYILDQQPSVMP